MSLKYFAHSIEGAPPSEWQSLCGHLNNVAELASEFASSFNSQDWAKVAGQLHDIGKAHPEFQEYLFKANNLCKQKNINIKTVNHPNHSGVGAILAYEKWKGIIGKIIAYIVTGHHSGLPDWFGGAASLPYRLDNERNITDEIRLDAKSFMENIPNKLLPPAFVKSPNAYHLWVRMLFSCLVDADFLDTEAFMDKEKHEKRPKFPKLNKLKQQFDQRLSEMMLDAPDTYVNRIRANVLKACRTAALHSPGLFSLTVPTGGGKTLSATAFALDHAIQYAYNKLRIIYVIPYTSIIEQTAEELRKYFGEENVVEHHSNIAIEKEEDTPELRLASENWDAPIIVTTSVQFFESLYAAKPGRCRKLHNIVNSVIILDEAQLIPPELLFPCVEVINRLVTDYNVTFVLSTATQPALPNLCADPYEIIPDYESLYNQLKRTEISFPEAMNQSTTWASLSNELIEHKQVLCIVNTRSDCYSLWKEMPEGTVHLSALMCGAHRSKVIADIKGKLPDGNLCRVISTQLVEAGVDISFPVVFRALSGLDSINQAAGRCNRNGELIEHGMVKVFIAPKPSPPGLLRKGEDTTRELAAMSAFIPDTPSIFKTYFEKYYSSINDSGENWWYENLIKNVNPEGNVQFRTVSKEFRIIKDTSMPVVVYYEDNDKIIETLKYAGPSRETLRKLQRYTVNITPAIARCLLQEKRIEEIHEGILVQSDTNLYSPDIGLDIYSNAYEPEDLYI